MEESDWDTDPSLFLAAPENPGYRRKTNDNKTAPMEKETNNPRNSIILKWNPGFSSYNMLQFLSDLQWIEETGISEYNWSVWDYEKVRKGDRFFWVKLGYGANGIVGSGEITSDPYTGEDWSGKGRQTYFVDFRPDTLINPDALPILSNERLQAEIPDFDWSKGHSGVVLTNEQAQKLESLWASFLKENEELMRERATNENSINDRFYCDRHVLE